MFVEHLPVLGGTWYGGCGGQCLLNICLIWVELGTVGAVGSVC